MNRDAIRHWLREEMNSEWQEHKGGFMVYSLTLGPDTLREVAACGAGLRRQRGEDAFLIFDARLDE